MNIHSIYKILSQHFRNCRMKQFEEIFRPTNDTSILDVGGSQSNWKFIEAIARITITNLTKPLDWNNGHNFKFELGDGRKLKYRDKSFDIVYSNSVIEHLYCWEHQLEFAREIQRVGKAYYLQTPAREFWIEPHYLTPFVHWLPKSCQKLLLRNFTLWGIIARPKQEYVDNTVEEIKLISLKELKKLFPDAIILKEKFMFFTKSYIAYKL